MEKGHRIKTLTITASTKVTPKEDERIRERATNCGLTKSEWCRQVLLEALDAAQGTRLVLAEVLALRTVVLRLYADSLQGVESCDERLKELIQMADAAKFSQAGRRIQTFHADILKPEKENT